MSEMPFLIGKEQMRKIIKLNPYKYLAILPLVFILSYCTNVIVNVPLYEIPPDWKDEQIRNESIKDYSAYLSGKKIFIDPGHGGADRKNKSRDGKIIEADVNLRVALALRNYLQKAGAEVFMSREKDTTIELADRSEMANNSGADIFISIHHNAPGGNEDNYTNYTSVYYHATDTDYVYEPCNRDLARYIQRDLSYVMRNSGGLGSFDGTYSDFRIYPGEGFSVLRRTNIPAVLIECAFHTNRFEELRLNDEVFNQIQGWGIFRGLYKYFRSGIPAITLLQNESSLRNDTLKLTVQLDDKKGIDPKSVYVDFDLEEIPFTFDPQSNKVFIQRVNLPAGTYPLKVVCANKSGNHSFPFNKKIEIKEGKETTVNQ